MADRSLFEPLDKKRPFEQIADEIKTLILNGTLNPGDKLPAEPEIASQFHVGRQTIRDAMRILEQSGFIAVERGAKGGPLVKDTILHRISALFIDALKMKRSSVQEFNIARTELENIIFRHALNNADESDVAALAENVRKTKEKLAKRDAAWGENVEFHRLLAKASKNYLFVIVMEAVCAIQADFIIGTPKESTFERVRCTTLEHQKILDAMMEGRREEAIRLFDEHIKDVPAKYYRLLMEKPSQSLGSPRVEPIKRGR